MVSRDAQNVATRSLIVVVTTTALLTSAAAPVSTGQAPASGASQRIDLVAELAAGRLRTVHRTVTLLDAGRPGVHVTERPEAGLVWIEDTDFTEGTIELEVRGRDVLQQSFLGVAFHRRNDTTYECVYLRPFNFRAADPARRQHAVQYMASPNYDWPRLRQEFPEEFENPVDASVSPTGWVAVRVAVAANRVRIFVGPGTTPALEVRKLGEDNRGMIGLWTGTGSDGDFATLRVTPAT